MSHRIFRWWHIRQDRSSLLRGRRVNEEPVGDGEASPFINRPVSIMMLKQLSVQELCMMEMKVEAVFFTFLKHPRVCGAVVILSDHLECVVA